MRIRPWLIGVVLVLGGFAVHVVFEVWAAPHAGRIEMGQFACFEFVLFAAGLGLWALSLAGRSAGRPRGGWTLWLVAALLAGLAVVTRLPP